MPAFLSFIIVLVAFFSLFWTYDEVARPVIAKTERARKEQEAKRYEENERIQRINTIKEYRQNPVVNQIVDRIAQIINDEKENARKIQSRRDGSYFVGMIVWDSRIKLSRSVRIVSPRTGYTTYDSSTLTELFFYDYGYEKISNIDCFRTAIIELLEEKADVKCYYNSDDGYRFSLTHLMSLTTQQTL